MARIPRPLPLVENPKTKEYNIVAGNCEVVITISACPDQWIRYDEHWKKRPPTGMVAVCEGQVRLKRAAQFVAEAPKVRVYSDGRFSGGGIAPGIRAKRLRSFELHDVDDFSFTGRIVVSV